MKRALWILLVALLVAPPSADAKTFKVLCGGFHFVRAMGSEILTTSYSIRNGNLDDPVTIRRLTIRNLFGAVVWDSGEGTPTDHPLNTDFTPGKIGRASCRERVFRTV